jgi:ParB/RepB/Spo0J family partition protein
MQVVQIEVDRIEQNENSRVVYKESDLSELMASMKKDGLLQPVGVRVIEKGRYDCVFGNRRILAAKKLGWVKIAASILERTNDQERDVLNLVENFKRQNTSVSEDGRMFAKLIEHGLTRSEIAARIGISVARVETALDVFNEFPKEFQKLIINTGQGKRQRAGTVSASMAFHINNIRKTNSLNRPQTRQILQYAKQDGVGMAQVSSIAPLMKSGMAIQKAIETVSKLEVLTLQLMIESRTIAKLEKENGKKIHAVLYDALEKKFKIERVGSRDSGISNRPRAEARV